MTIEELISKELKVLKEYYVLEGEQINNLHFAPIERKESSKLRKKYIKGGALIEMPLFLLKGYIYSDKNYNQLVEQFIRLKYSVSDELGLLRQKDRKSDEFVEYDNYVEECKLKAKNFITEREDQLGGSK